MWKLVAEQYVQYDLIRIILKQPIDLIFLLRYAQFLKKIIQECFSIMVTSMKWEWELGGRGRRHFTYNILYLKKKIIFIFKKLILKRKTKATWDGLFWSLDTWTL